MIAVVTVVTLAEQRWTLSFLGVHFLPVSLQEFARYFACLLKSPRGSKNER